MTSARPTPNSDDRFPGVDSAAGARRATGQRTPTRGQDGRGPGRATARLGQLTRTSLERFDRYTLDVFNAGTPHRSGDDRTA